jgi:hypothetical protein
LRAPERAMAAQYHSPEPKGEALAYARTHAAYNRRAELSAVNLPDRPHLRRYQALPKGQGKQHS